eukprot:4938100-Alexandrium_andersonii.AAC.1
MVTGGCARDQHLQYSSVLKDVLRHAHRALRHDACDDISMHRGRVEPWMPKTALRKRSKGRGKEAR